MKVASEKSVFEENNSYNSVLKEFENVAKEINFLEKYISLKLIEEVLEYLNVPTSIQNIWESWKSCSNLVWLCVCVVYVCVIVWSVCECIYVYVCYIYVCVSAGVCV